MSIERQIAGKAKDLVSAQIGQAKESEYRALCESFPMLLRGAGLAQTLAFVRVKHGVFYEHLESQFRTLGMLGQETLSEKAADPRLSLAEYRLYSEVAMHAALWHKRMAQALLKKKPKEKATP
jgi:CRISPR type III-B/RAMP module-associated protein Cmr5